MKISDNFEINNYKDFQEHKTEIFDIIEGTMDLISEEIIKKNPTFLIPNYDSLVNVEDFKLGVEKWNSIPEQYLVKIDKENNV